MEGVLMGHLHNTLKLSVAIASIFLCILLTSCGGSSTGGGKKSTNPAEERLDVYDFNLSTLNSDPLSIYYTAFKKSVEIKEGSTGVFDGSYTPKTGAYIINYLSMLNINAPLWDDVSNSFSVQVTEAVKSSGGQFPDEGKLRIIDKGANLIMITLSAKAVTIAYNNDAAISLSWNDFTNLVGSQADTYKQQAALAWSIMSLVSSQIDLAMDEVVTIQDNKNTITQAAEHKMAIPCDVLPGQDQGIRSLQWKDANGNKVLDSGDDFLLTFGNCWENAPKSTYDILLFGPVHLNNFVEETKTVNNTSLLIKTGFTVQYDGLTVSETVENPSGTFTIDDTKTRILDGGFSIMLTEPAQ
jgi:hypothetical protein